MFSQTTSDAMIKIGFTWLRANSIEMLEVDTKARKGTNSDNETTYAIEITMASGKTYPFVGSVNDAKKIVKMTMGEYDGEDSRRV